MFMVRSHIFESAFALGVVGALTLIIVNLLLLVGIADVIIPFYSLIPSRYIFPLVIGLSGDYVINIACGLIALVSSRRIHSPAWAIVLIVVSIVAGGVGGALVLIGGILALIGKLT